MNLGNREPGRNKQAQERGVGLSGSEPFNQRARPNANNDLAKNKANTWVQIFRGIIGTEGNRYMLTRLRWKQYSK